MTPPDQLKRVIHRIHQGNWDKQSQIMHNKNNLQSHEFMNFLNTCQLISSLPAQILYMIASSMDKDEKSNFAFQADIDHPMDASQWDKSFFR